MKLFCLLILILVAFYKALLNSCNLTFLYAEKPRKEILKKRECF